MASLLEAALDYHQSGWCVIPTTGKRAATSWKPYQSRRPSESQLKSWFVRKNVDGIAVILGKVSGRLWCRDFDDANAYHAWATKNPHLANTLPTVQTARGFHVYCRGDLAKTVKVPDGELRGERCYCVLPPSRHPSGSTYRWIKEPGEAVPLVNPKDFGVNLPATSPVAMPVSPTSNHHPPTATHTPTHTHHPHSLHVSQDLLQAIIQRTLPAGTGERNRRVFDLAKSLRRIMPNAKPNRLRRIVTEWHALALPVIRTKDFATTWADFIVAWNRIRARSFTFHDVVESAKALRTPPAAAIYNNSPSFNLLVAICAQLERHYCGRPWPLGCRIAGAAIGVSKSEAARMLKALKFDGIIRQVSPASLSDHKATEYRFIPGNGGQ